MRAGQRGVASDAFVQEVWVGGIPAAEVWAEGVKYYPDERTTVRDIVLGGGDDAYWVHTADAIKKGVQGMLLELELNGQRYHLGQGDGTLPILQDAGGAWRADATLGLKLSDVLHATATLTASVPERRMMLDAPAMTGGEDVTLRVLPVIAGTRTRWVQWGGKRHAHGHYWQAFTSPSTEEEFFRRELYKSGRTSRRYTFNVSAGPVSDTYSNLRIWFYMTKHSGGAHSHTIIYPAFTRSWTVKVLGCTLQRKDI